MTLMLMPPTTTVSISRGETTNAEGDPVDIDIEPFAVGVPAIISYKARIIQDPASGTPRQVTAYECVLDGGTDVQDDDRLTDEQTGTTYQVVGVTQLPSYGIPADMWVALSQVG